MPTYPLSEMYCSTYREFEDARSRVRYTQTPALPAERKCAVSFDGRFEDPTYDTISETFRFLFDKFKKGIFVQIHGGQLKTFMEFSNAYYKNNWSNRVDFKEGCVDFSDPKIQPVEKWYANNYLVRYENPFNENHTGTAELLDLMKEVCASHTIPDVEFFINRRDFPLIRKDGCEPYTSIFGDEAPADVPAKLGLVVSMVATNTTMDVPFITPDDWSRSCKKAFSGTKRSSTIFRDEFVQLSWRSKTNKVVFRGSNTGEKFGEARLRLCEICARDSLFDVKLTSISTRKQIIDGRLLDPVQCGIPERAKQHHGRYLTLREQAQHRYIIHIQGHVQSFRLGTMLALKSVILLVESDSKLWFENKLTAWVHYVPVKKDLSDLLEKVRWCQTHEGECEQIALESRRFYETYLSKQGCVQYVADLLRAYRAKMAPRLYAGPIERVIQPMSRPIPVELSGVILTKGRCFASLVAIDVEKTFKMSNHVVKRDATSSTLLLLPTTLDSPPTCVGAKRGHRIRHEFEVGTRALNALLKDVPNFAYTFQMDKDVLYIEEITQRRFTLRHYICSAKFRCAGLLNILKQLALSLSYAQNKCFFIHGAAVLDNIILAQLPFSEYDVPVGPNEVWRVACEELTPIWINYEQATAIAEDGALLCPRRPNDAFETFLDCAVLLLSSMKEAFRIGMMSMAQKTLCLDTVNKIFKDTDGAVFRGAATVRELCQFLESITDDYLLEAVRGNVLFKTPMDLFHAIDDERFRRVEGVVATHFGKTCSLYHLPSEETALMNRYYYQWLVKISAGSALTFIETNYTPKLLCEGWYIRAWDIKDSAVDKGISPRTLGTLNVIESLLSDGSSLALTPEERTSLLSKSSELLRLKPTIWTTAVSEWKARFK